MPRVPDAAEQRRQFLALPFDERREVLRAASRGQPVTRRKLAVHAVALAQRQQRTWRRLWLAGPLVGLTQINLGWQAALSSALISTLTMALVARFWWGRARRAELVNLALTNEGRKAGGKRSGTSGTAGSRNGGKSGGRAGKGDARTKRDTGGRGDTGGKGGTKGRRRS